MPISGMRLNKKSLSLVAYLAGPILILLIWSVISSLVGNDTLYLASPKETFISLEAFLNQKEFYLDIFYTLQRVLLSVAIATLLAIPVALLISFKQFLFTMSEFIIDFFRSIPSVALFPLFLVIFGINDTARTGTAVFICFWIVLLNLLLGIFHASRVRTESLEVIGATKIQIFRHVLFWESLAPLVAGIRLALTTSLVIIILTEMLVSPKFGIGAEIFLMQQTYKIPEMYVLILITGCVGYILNKCVVTIERKIIHWTRG